MPSFPPENRSELLSHLRADQSARWQRGERVRVEHYLAQYPDLASDAEALLRLVYIEMLNRLARGEQFALEEYLERFPQQSDGLRRTWDLLKMAHTELWSQAGLPRTTAPDEVTAHPTPLPEVPAPPPGPELPGLELHEQLGEGGMGVVYRARDLRLDQPRAIKIIRTGPFAGQEARDRFHREARAVARLDHPGVVRIYALGEHDKVLYICMEYLEGGSLQERLRRGPLEVRATADLVRQLALAVHHAHENKVLHRDLKPANVLLTTAGAPKISDFGLAKLLDADDELTQTGALLGTPAYMAPEQAEVRWGDIGERTDVWALGVILYECLTGRPPFKGGSRVKTLDLVKTQRPVPPRRLRAEVPAQLEAICLRCLEKKAERRYPTAADLAAELQAWLDGKPQTRPPGRRLRRYWPAAAGAAVLLAGLGTAAFLNLPRDEEPDPAVAPVPAIPPVMVVAPAPKPGVWQPLLSREPTPLRWPGAGKNNHKLYQPDKQQLVLSCEELGLLALGQTTATRFHLAITIQQTPLVGNVGLFFGHQDCLVGNEQAQCYQVIELVSEPDPKQGRLLRADWKTVQHVGAARPQKQFNNLIGVSSYLTQTPGEHRLKLTIGPKGLEQVTWDDAVLPQLHAGGVAEPPAPAEYRGQFGIFVNNGNGLFRDARYLFEQEP